MSPGPDIEALYSELRELAARSLGSRKRTDTLQPTALVHEAYLRMAHNDGYRGRTHFLAVAATAMRQILIDRARRAAAAKRAGTVEHISCDIAAEEQQSDVDVLAFDEALQRLAAHDARKARVVELRVFGGLTIQETAQELGVSGVTVSTDWRFSRAWMCRELGLTIKP
jgi:RNA polymerase sigma-70 factor (ECF subfamily)